MCRQGLGRRKTATDMKGRPMLGSFLRLSLLIIFLASGLAPGTSRSEDSTTGGKPAGKTNAVQNEVDLSGRFVGAHGTEFVVVAPEEVGGWLAIVREPGARPVTLELGGGPDSLRPKAMHYTAEVDGQPVEIFAEGGKIFALGEVGGARMEFLKDREGTRVLVDDRPGADDSPVVEGRMMLDDIAARWRVIQQTRFSLNTNGLAVSYGSREGSKSFCARTADLSEPDRRRLAARRGRLARMRKSTEYFIEKWRKMKEQKQ